MILEYHRPKTLAEALTLLHREEPLTLAMGGGTLLSRQRQPDFAVVDLQALGLDMIEQEGQLLRAGATTTLQQVFDCENIPPSISVALRRALQNEAGLNMRHAATLAGTVCGCDGRSPLITALLALDPRLAWAGDEPLQSLGDFLALRDALHARLMLEVRFPLNVSLEMEMVGRSPMDLPLVVAAVGRWPSGRVRVTLGGFGKAPVLAFDGPQQAGAAEAAREAYRLAGDQWASAEYRAEVAGRLVARILQNVETQQ